MPDGRRTIPGNARPGVQWTERHGGRLPLEPPHDHVPLGKVGILANFFREGVLKGQLPAVPLQISDLSLEAVNLGKRG